MRRWILLIAFGGAAQSWAGSVYLNNVNIDGVTNQKFDKATVRIDDKGNVFIDAPGYAVKQVDAKPSDPVAQPGVLTRQYYLVTEQNAVGMTEYDIDVFINAKWVRKLRSSDEQLVMEITKHLVPGKNTVVFQAKKVSPKDGRKSFSSEHLYRVILGEGKMSGNHVMIDNPQVKFERTAAQTDDVSQEFALTTR